MAPPSTSAYVNAPTSGTGTGVLVLHSWWGLTDAVKERCNALSDHGYTALAPDLFDGEVARDADHGQELLFDADPDRLVMAVRSCADALQRMPVTPDGRILVVGYSMGSSLGLWLSEREHQAVAAVVGYYGTQGMDFERTESDYQFHMAIDDPMLDPDELALMEASLGLADRPVEIHTYEAGHWFAEDDTPGFDAAADALAWQRTLEFLDRHR